MSNDVESRLLDLELRFGHFLTNTSETFAEFHGQAAETAAQTSAVIAVILEELIDDGALDRGRLIHAMEIHAGSISDGGRFGTRRLAVESLLSHLRPSRKGGGSRSSQ
ncbi:hypothetical protein [Methylobacterium brachythecii]|uniref:Uncharacterized protein n=1 Tax=Methylobacterium brachythecii TaxID=1176177 RepID=A0A7W6F6M2_9HYPH|nr:hypothetical protein [Methylobacterium brachythecii]MBB3902181.1 hypothetical protein [Methylobacterium brachythecii]GLS42026.1 hypothetical protein GCM10007884_00110 [Methylobacterium brachythecii]